MNMRNLIILVLKAVIIAGGISSTYAAVRVVDSSEQSTDAELGRLFFTTSQRKKIDATRQRMNMSRKGGAESVVRIKRSNNTIMIHGYIVRERAETVVWGGNKNTLKGTLKSASVTINGAVHDGKISVLVSGSRLPVKPGQKLLLDKKRVIEGYLDRPYKGLDEARPTDG